MGSQLRELFRPIHVLKQGSRCSILFLFFGLLIPRGVYTQERQFPGNGEFLANAVRSLALEWIQYAKIPSGESLKFTQDSAHNALSGFMADRFVESLQNDGFSLYVGKEAREGTYTLRFSLRSALVVYENVFHQKFLGRAWIRRSAHVNVFLQLLDSATRKLMWIGEYDHVSNDEFPRTLLGDIEMDRIPDIQPIRPKEHGARRWAEPVFVIGVLGSLIYLFYSVRSQ